MIHANRARLERGIFTVDRKFHLGMQLYVRNIAHPLVSVHLASTASDQVMDPVDIPDSDLEYGVIVLKAESNTRILPRESVRLFNQIRQSKLVYGGGFGGAALARSIGVPYILILEYDLLTQVAATVSEVSNMARKALRAIRCVSKYVTGIHTLSSACGLHCNGYPMFDESRLFNSNRLLYLDSRMARDMIISEDNLKARLSGRTGRPLRLLYSGRYERMKGADDAVRVGVECLKRGLQIEMHCYGQGSLKSEMEHLAAQSADPVKIQIHDAVPYPNLVKLSREFDIFVCCHIQGDPSCTYLESFGSGLPIVGYNNKMWRRLRDESRAGFSSPLGRPEAVADAVQRFAADREALALMSNRAREFAIEHTFESEFKRRTDDLNLKLETLSAAV